MVKLAGRHLGIPGFYDRLEVSGPKGKALFQSPGTMSGEELRAGLAEYAKKATQP